MPGAGKSTLAEGLARELRAPVFSMEWQLGTLTPFRNVTNENQTPVAEMMLVGALARQLQLGLDVVTDATGHEVEGGTGIGGLPQASEAWSEPHLIMDSATQDAGTTLKRVLDAVATGRSS
ncbi:hypothetical protein Caci_5953 [Catenulispora acidiphila DSM 44928]|uniref:Uncharacterized protein n=1 Tax=Catenulispora acidiphila (strain DSM 44928 / JCM 14897 / NBRC 102108 / NRRL B-24433 / ID139908) TaxID=479433 RepID=C7QF53_CATAD|nr:hypothetical protein [Catenulispora acidiphila]ACU74811.1 hypothetical protein Caci_5953 [Catenulispora acidiphila DSM 44928]